MFDNLYSSYNERPRAALEVAMRARSQEKSMALKMADYRSESAREFRGKVQKNRGLIGSLLAIFRAI